METYIALVRHGATDWNYDARAQGHADIPLNREGREQAEAVAALLATERWDAIYSSDLSRAHQTALAIGSRASLSVSIDARLRERAMGPSEGTTAAERSLRWPGIDHHRIPGRESDEALAQRALIPLTEIAQRHQGQRVVVITHGGLIATFLHLIGADPAQARVPRNTGVVPVIWDGQRFTSAGPQRFEHLLIGGVEYSSEKWRLVRRGTLAGFPGLELPPDQIEPFVLNATAVESAWVNERPVGFLRAFTDQIRQGYVDICTSLPDYAHVEPILIRRLERRFPGVTFMRLEPSEGLGSYGSRPSESAPA